MTGGYQRMGDRMRITARVTDTETGAVAASAKADGDVSEIFSLQDRIADDLGNLLLVRITGGSNAATSASRAALPADRGNDNRNTTATGNGNGNGEAALPGRPARPAPLPPAEVTGGLELGAATASEDDFSVNGYNVQGDSIINARGGGGGGGRGGGGGGGGGFGRSGIPFGDDSWDALFDSGAQIVDDGFTAEMAIPFKSLRYPRRDREVPHRWAFQIVREIRDKDENVVWRQYRAACPASCLRWASSRA